MDQINRAYTEEPACSFTNITNTKEITEALTEPEAIRKPKHKVLRMFDSDTKSSSKGKRSTISEQRHKRRNFARYGYQIMTNEASTSFMSNTRFVVGSPSISENTISSTLESEPERFSNNSNFGLDDSFAVKSNEFVTNFSSSTSSDNICYELIDTGEPKIVFHGVRPWLCEASPPIFKRPTRTKSSKNDHNITHFSSI